MNTSTDSIPIKFDLAPDPRGPMTLREHASMQKFALDIQDRVSCGNGYIAPGTRERMVEALKDFTARQALSLEMHPELATMNAQHEALLENLENTSDEAVRIEIQSQCAELARQIVALERELDV